jgi:hypothetical protein
VAERSGHFRRRHLMVRPTALGRRMKPGVPMGVGARGSGV